MDYIAVQVGTFADEKASPSFQIHKLRESGEYSAITNGDSEIKSLKNNYPRYRERVDEWIAFLELRDEMRPKYGGRAANSCERAGLFTLRDVSALGRKRFGQRLGVGPGSLLCLDELLAAHGMRWSDAPALTRSDEAE